MTTDDSDQTMGATHETPQIIAGEDRSNSGVSRRSFLKAAALGTAAAALLNQTSGGGLSFGPLSAFANDLSNLPCTANDVNILGTGIVLNEPCSCSSGTFNAQVQFTVRNNTGTGRYCIALHLVATTAGGVTIPGQDVILIGPDGTSTAPANKDTVMKGTITNFPCNSGGSLVCFGAPNEPTSGKCAPGTCSTIAWDTSNKGAGCTTANQSPPGGQCRHQQVCVQGFGATLSCKSGCTPTCGGTAVLTATVGGGVQPWTYHLTGTDGSSQSFGPTNDTSHDFTVIVTQNTIYTVTVTDSKGCSRTAQTSLNAAPVTAALAKPSASACGDGKVTFNASGTGCASPVFTWKVNGTPVATGSSFTYDPTASYATLHGADVVSVTADCGSGCTATQQSTVTNCITTTAS